MTTLTCSLCSAPIPAHAPRSVADDDTVLCAACYETAMRPGERPRPTVPHRASVGATSNAYHDHLDRCTWCREHPFALCAEGARALREAASVPVPLSAFDAGWRDGWDIPPDPTGAREPTDVDDR